MFSGSGSRLNLQLSDPLRMSTRKQLRRPNMRLEQPFCHWCLQATGMDYRRQATFHHEDEEDAGSVHGEKGHEKGPENVSSWVLDGFSEILTTLVE